MPRNASGVYTLPAGNPVIPGTTIDAAWANDTLEDLANEVTNSLSRTGAGGMLAPFRIADGNITAPGISFLNETNTGLYRSGAGSAWMAVLGVNVAQFSTVGLTIASAKALTALGNASVGGTFAVTGATTVASTLAVTGALTATGGVLGNITAGSGTSTFNNVVINGNLDMDAGSSGTITNLPNPTNPGDAANKAYVDSQDALRLALTGGTMTGVIAMSNNKVTGVATPTNDQDAANKAYVDTVAQGLDVKGSCRAATVANITLSGTQTIDGVAVIAGDRVLVKDQSTAANNGIYVVAAGSWSRSADADTWNELVGAFTFVEDGTVNDNSGWVCTSAPGGTLGVTAVTFEQFSGAGQINAGQGLSKSGNTIQVNTASSARIVIGADDIDLATTGVVANTYKSVTVDAYGRVTAGTNPTTLAGFGIGDAYTQAQTDSLLAAKLSLAGGTMSGAIAMGGSKITGMADPTLAQDAATKNYIDTIFGSTASAAASASAAATSASNAASSASAASSSASNASSSASAAASSASAAAASFDSFDDRYLGAKASDPTVDNDGNPLLTGALYWNTTVGQMRVYDGSAWIAAYLPAVGYMDLTTNQTAAGTKTFSSDVIANGLTVGRGAGAGNTNTTFGYLGFYSNSSGTGDVAIGREALYANTTGSSNTAIGTYALTANTTASENTAVGYQAGYSNTVNGALTAVGYRALYNSTGTSNTAVGRTALYSNTTGAYNVALGRNALYSNTTASNNTAVGYTALFINTGSANTALGSGALYSNQTASNNTAIGEGALYSNTTGQNQVAVGTGSLAQTTTGNYNVAVGSGVPAALYSALGLNTTGAQNTAVGTGASEQNTTGSYNVSMGYAALAKNTTASNNTAVGYQAGYSNTTGGVTAFGDSALRSNTTGTINAAFGRNAAYNTSTGTSNTAIGAGGSGVYAALQENTTGSYNTAVGAQAIAQNLTGSNITAVGYGALYTNKADNNTAVGYNVASANTTGAYNVVMGGNDSGSQPTFGANTTGSYNTAIGMAALRNNTTALHNTAVGYQAGYSSTTGGAGTFIGRSSGYAVTTASDNTFLGYESGLTVTTGGSNTFVGTRAGAQMTTGTKNTIFGRYEGYTAGGLDIRTLSNRIVISDGDGNVREYIDNTGAWMLGTVTNRGVGGLSINPNTSNGAADITFNRNSTASTSYVVGFQNAGSTVGYIAYNNTSTTYATSSDARLKMNPALADDAGAIVDSILIRKFDWITDGSHQRFGVIAQELQTVYPEAVAAPEDEDKMMGVDYSKMVPLLVKEIQSLRARVATLEGV